MSDDRRTGLLDSLDEWLSFEVELDRVNERHQPLEQGLVCGMCGVSVGSGLVVEGHEAGECVALPARREVRSDVNIDETGDLSAKGENLLAGAEFVSFSGFRLPFESEDVNEHCGLLLSSCYSPIANLRPASSSFATLSFEHDSE